MASLSSSSASTQNASIPTTTSPLVHAVSVSPAVPSILSVNPSSQEVIDLTKHSVKHSDTSSSSSSSAQSSKSLFPTFPSTNPAPQIGTKRSPSPNILASLQSSKGRSPSPALISKSQSSSQMSYSRSHSPISMLQHSQSEPSVHSSQDGPPPKKKRLFHRELVSMMRGFGDDPNPYSETVDLIEELVVRFITEMTQKAMDVGKSGRVQVNDIIFIIRKDPKKYARVKDLLMMKEQIDKAKKAFTEDAETSDE